MSRYAKLFGADLAGWHFLTGSAAEVEAVIAAWGMWAKIGPTASSTIRRESFCSIPAGRQREIYNLEFLKADSVLEDVRGLLAEKC